jgi:hypothetical protein
MLTYGQALRAIGQDLESHGAFAYEIKVNEGEYQVQCDCELPPPGNLLFFSCTSRILEQLDFMGRLKRTGASLASSPEALSATLRSLGAYVDREKGRLLRVTNYESPGPDVVFRVEFALADGTRVENTFSKPALDAVSASLRQERSDYECGKR